jgi:hypothetical protein
MKLQWQSLSSSIAGLHSAKEVDWAAQGKFSKLFVRVT